MTTIFLLAFAAAVFPLLIASVAILLSRPRPRRLLLAFYAGGMIASLLSGIVVVILFDHGDSAAGSTQSNPTPWASIAEGVVGLLLAWLMITSAGRRLTSRLQARVTRSRRASQAARPAHDAGPSWVERRLDGSLLALFAAGAVINLPGPYYLLALGRIAEGGYSSVGKAALILAFNLIMFLLLELPLVSYMIDPERTATLVAAAGEWLTRNGLRITGGLVGVYGAALLIQGLAVLL